MDPPLLPWEVLERIIGHSGDHSQTLHNFSLTCHNLRPRALCLLVSDVRFKTRADIFDFCEFLQAKSHLKPLVRSIALHPDDFAPFPLLNILPNLAKVAFTPIQLHVSPQIQSVALLNQSSLTCCERFGTHIQTLHLSDLFFATYADFARVLLAFTNLADLACYHVIVTEKVNPASLNVLKRRLSERLHLRTLDIDFRTRVGDLYNKQAVHALLLTVDPGLVRLTLEALTVRWYYRPNGLSRPFNWPRLQSLVLRLNFNVRDIADAVEFLKEFSPSTLQDVRVESNRISMEAIYDVFTGKTSPQRLDELEQALLRFARPQIMCHMDGVREGTKSFWAQELAKRFPSLSQRGAFTFTSGTAIPGPGHDDGNGILDFIASPNAGERVATVARRGSIIILWDAAVGTIVQQWIPHSHKFVTSLAFSLDGRYLVSAGEDSKVKVWDISASEGGLRQVATLEGHTHRISCSWSPRGDVIASGSQDGIIRLWDAHAFRELRVLKRPKMEVGRPFSIESIVFSPDGRWLVYELPKRYRIWDVDSGTLHKWFYATTVHRSPAVFDPGSTRLLVPEDNAVKLVDVETGRELALLRGLPGYTAIESAAFSPDGTLLLTGTGDGAVKLWDACTGVEIFSLRGHTKDVFMVRVSPCGKYVASASKDGLVGLWRTRNGSCVAMFSEHQDRTVYCVAFTPDGERLLSGDRSGSIIVRRMRDIIPADEQAL